MVSASLSTRSIALVLIAAVASASVCAAVSSTNLGLKRAQAASLQDEAKSVRDSMQLLFVAEVFRHGARFALNDSFWNANQQQSVWGQLTPTGMRQHYTLGQLLRSEYVDERQFLPPNYNHTYIWVYSTDVNRTLESAYSQLQGLYPPTQGPYVPSTLVNYSLLLPAYKNVTPVQQELNNYTLPQLMQVLPVHTQPAVQDELMQPWSSCATLNNWTMAYINQNPKWMSTVNEQYQPIYSQFNTILGNAKPGNVTFENSEDLYDTLICDAFNGYPLPSAMTTQLWQGIAELDTLYWFAKYGSTLTVSQIVNSHLLARIQNLMLDVVNGANPLLKLALFSGHDTNVVSLMYALNISNVNCVSEYLLAGKDPFKPGVNCFQRAQFAANILIELYNASTTASTSPKDYQVMVRYNGEYVYVCGQAQWRCSLSDFMNSISQTIISQKQWDTLCTTNPKSEEEVAVSQATFLPATQTLPEVSTATDDGNWTLKAAIAAESVVLIALASYVVHVRKARKTHAK